MSPLNKLVLGPSGEGSSLTRRRSVVRVHPGLLDAQVRQQAERLGSGTDAQLVAECLQVRLLLWVLTTQRFGRRLADHLGSGTDRRLVAGMLWVRLPPEPLTTTRPRGAAECSPACHAGDRGFKSHRGRFNNLARYANWQSGEAQTFVIVCGFDSHPCY